ncbi:MAG: twin-arginine translocase TatA/TatE family subunit [Actinomycetota bacterium]|nr:twin-arginine translocase TatA/TatE family subunit [Actinomycetota bacterium]
MPGGIGPLELGIVLLIVLVVFGPKRLPSLGRQLGSGMREFKDSITGKARDDDDERPQVVAASDTQPAVERREDAVSRPRA